MITAEQVKFGVEFEVIIPTENWGARPIGRYHGGVQVADLPAGWKVERDGSIRPSEGCIGVEIVSPILCGPEGLKQVVTVLEWINSLGGKVNASCGLHLTTSFPLEDKDALRRLVHFVARHEYAIFATTGSQSRMRNHYCGPISESFATLKTTRKMATFLQSYAPQDRYHMLNLSHLTNGSNRIEFRAFAGTTNVTKVLGYIQLVVGIVVKALNDKSTPKWERGEVKDESRGRGKKAVYCMLRALKWSTAKKNGIGVMDGDSLPTVRKEFDRLARKFDGNVWAPKRSKKAETVTID